MAPRRGIASTSPVNPHATCLLCGMQVPSTYLPEFPNSFRGGTNTQDHQLLKESQWKSCWKSDLKHVIVPSHEVEEAYFSNFPQLWSCFCRACEFLTRGTSDQICLGILTSTVIKESDTKYRLTGINLLQPETTGPYYAPNDPAKARIGGKKMAKYHYRIFTKFYAASIERQPDQYRGKLIGYIIHAHCWVLFGLVEGLKLNKAKLAKLVQVCRKYWRNIPWEYPYHNNRSWGIYAHGHCIEPRGVQPEFAYPYIFQNPLVVPAVQEAINRANIERLRVSNTGCHHPSSYSSNLPLEVAILIAECVCPVKYTVDDVKDTRNMLLVFEWKLPDWFWRERLDEHFFVELDRLKKASSPVEWQLRLNLMSLVADRTWFSSSGLANRERVLEIMLGFEKAYLG